MTEEVENFLIEHFDEFNDRQKLCVYQKFHLLKNKTKKQEEALKKVQRRIGKMVKFDPVISY